MNTTLPPERLAQLSRLGVTFKPSTAAELDKQRRDGGKRNAPLLTKHICICGRPAVERNNSGGWDCALCVKARSPHRNKRRIVKQQQPTTA